MGFSTNFIIENPLVTVLRRSPGNEQDDIAGGYDPPEQDLPAISTALPTNPRNLVESSTANPTLFLPMDVDDGEYFNEEDYTTILSAIGDPGRGEFFDQDHTLLAWFNDEHPIGR